MNEERVVFDGGRARGYRELRLERSEQIVFSPSGSPGTRCEKVVKRFVVHDPISISVGVGGFELSR